MASGGDSSDLATNQRWMKLQEKEARIRALERELDDFEQENKTISQGARLPKNWPCKSYAFARNAIGIDILDSSQQKSVRKFYSLWWLTTLCTLFNWLSIVIWASYYESESSFQDYFFATLYMVAGTPLSWMLLYKRYYRAMMDGGALGSMFFLFQFAHLVWCGVMSIGFTSVDAAGWLIMAKVFVDGHDGLGFLMLVTSLLWTINVIATLYLLREAQGEYGKYLYHKHNKEAIMSPAVM